MARTYARAVARATAFAVLAGLCAAQAWGATITVTSLADETSTGNGCSLREAIVNANADAQIHADCAAGTGADTIRFSRSGTITLSLGGLPTVTDVDGLTIDGSPRFVTISGNDAHRHFAIDAGRSLVLRYLTLADGHAPDGTTLFPSLLGTPGGGGGSIVNGGTLRLESVRITSSRAGNGGGSINSPGIGGSGGAIFNAGGTVEAYGVLLDDNDAGNGGVNANSPASNAPSGHGGAIYNDGGIVRLLHATLFRNATEGGAASGGYGGAIYTTGAGRVDVIYSTFRANSGRFASGIYADAGDVGLFATIMANSQVSGECDGSTGVFSDAGYSLAVDSTCNLAGPGSAQSVALASLELAAGLGDAGGFLPSIALGTNSIAKDRLPFNLGPGFPTFFNCADLNEAPLAPVPFDVDGRPLPRPSVAGGSCDAGAFEVGPFQLLTFAQPPSPAAYGSTFQVAPSSSVGLPVTVTAEGGCSAVAGVAPNWVVQMTSATTPCVLVASQAGVPGMPPARNVERTVAATTAALLVDAGDAAKTFGSPDPSFPVAISGFAPGDDAGDLGGALVLTFAGTAGTVYGPSTTPPSGAGTYSITPSGYTSAIYAITYQQGAYAIARAAQAIAVTTSAPASAGHGTSFAVAATGGGSGNPVAFGSAGACTNSGATFTMIAPVGTCTVTYDQAGDANHDPAPQVMQSLVATAGDVLSLSKSAEPTSYATVGTVIAYGIVVTNAGLAPVSAIAVSDPVAGAVTCPGTTLAAGESMTCIASLSIDQGDLDAGKVVNTATATSAETVAATSNEVTVVAAQTFALTAVKSATPTTFRALGETIAYQVVVTNTGNVTLHSLAIDDPLTADEACPVATLAPGASTVCTASHAVTAADLAAGVIANTATITTKQISRPTNTVQVLLDAGADIDDGDGVPAAVEDAAPNGGDGNGDGIPDSRQPGVVSLPAAAGNTYLTLSSSCELHDVAVFSEADVGDDPEVSYPFGLIAFRAPCPTASFSLVVHQPAQWPLTYRKYGPNPPGSATSTWYALPGVTAAPATVAGAPVVRFDFALADGQVGDDTAVDGVIVDQGGPAARYLGIPAVDIRGLAALAALLAVAGAALLRRQGRRSLTSGSAIGRRPS